MADAVVEVEAVGTCFASTQALVGGSLADERARCWHCIYGEPIKKGERWSNQLQWRR
ncbi:MAG: hypothetical protein ACRDQ2_13090 [Gaiellales bacterium]